MKSDFLGKCRFLYYTNLLFNKKMALLNTLVNE
jgi:hypothetical protein